MRTLYLDCGMGAAGDMLTAALLELLPDPEGFVKELNALGIPGVEYVREDAVKCGIGGTHMSVRIHGEEESEEMLRHHHEHEHHHEHTHEHDHDHGEIVESEIKDRPLSDFAGDFQSVLPYFEDGTLDEYITEEAEENEKSFDEMKQEFLEKRKSDYNTSRTSPKARRSRCHCIKRASAARNPSFSGR